MKKKTTKYVLLVAVLAVWSLVMVRIFSGNATDTAPVALFELHNDGPIAAAATDTFGLIGNYADPFLGGKPKASKPKRRTTSSSGSAARSSPSARRVADHNTAVNNDELLSEPWPTIAFYGTLENQNQPQRIGILSVNNEQLIVSAGDVVMNLHVVNVYEDSVLLMKNNETLAFGIKND